MMTDFEMECIHKATEFAYECLINTKVKDPELFDYAKTYRYDHSLRVGQNAKIIAEDEINKGHNVNVFVCCMAGVLHDIGKFQAFIETDKNHGLVGAIMAKPFLTELGLDEKTVNEICYCISSHSGDYHDMDYPEILEAHITEEADDLDRYSMYRVLAKISDWEEECITNDEIVDKCSQYIDKLKKALSKVNCKTEYGQRELMKSIQTQIDAFSLYKSQVEKTKEIK